MQKKHHGRGSGSLGKSHGKVGVEHLGRDGLNCDILEMWALRGSEKGCVVGSACTRGEGGNAVGPACWGQIQRPQTSDTEFGRFPVNRRKQSREDTEQLLLYNLYFRKFETNRDDSNGLEREY